MTYPSDTPREVEDLQICLLREKSAAERVSLALRLSSEVIAQSKRAIRRAHPDWTPREIGQYFIELHYGKELADAVRRYVATRDNR